jgi:hypothetical protein
MSPTPEPWRIVARDERLPATVSAVDPDGLDRPELLIHQQASAAGVSVF